MTAVSRVARRASIRLREDAKGGVLFKLLSCLLDALFRIELPPPYRSVVMDFQRPAESVIQLHKMGAGQEQTQRRSFWLDTLLPTRHPWDTVGYLCNFIMPMLPVSMLLSRRWDQNAPKMQRWRGWWVCSRAKRSHTLGKLCTLPRHWPNSGTPWTYWTSDIKATPPSSFFASPPLTYVFLALPLSQGKTLAHSAL